jgi:regulator of sigma E protease
MTPLPGILGTIADVVLVVLAFSSIILIHELGHFLAARWAGVRVMAFALGFGPAVGTFRKGMGFRWGSSEPEFLRRFGGGLDPSGVVSPTEYRLNWFPLGGYVKPLGQDDADPTARSDAPDSYQSCKPWKRMVFISAGVVFNLVSAAVFFVVVFSVGLKTEAARIGFVQPGSPAATTPADNAASAGVARPGLQAGDRVLRINGAVADSFKDISLASAMAAKGTPVELEVERAGVAVPLVFSVLPRTDPTTRMLTLGVGPAASGVVLGGGLTGQERDEARKVLDRAGLVGVEGGWRLARVGDRAEGLTAADLDRAAQASAGKPFEVEFKGPGAAERATVTVRPMPTYPSAALTIGDGTVVPTPHLLGLAPLMAVGELNKQGEASGLRTGDVFARLGDAEWPDPATGIAQIRRARGSIAAVVLRETAPGSGVRERVELPSVPVINGVIGFDRATSAGAMAVVAPLPSLPGASGTGGPMTGATLGIPAGSRIVTVDGEAVGTLDEVWVKVQAKAAAGGAKPLAVVLAFRPPAEAAKGEAVSEQREVRWETTAEEAARLALTTWASPIDGRYFEIEETLLRGEGPVGALSMGLRETRRAMLSTYVTFLRLFQGTVRVEHLKGPVGIAHVGTLLASRGWVWLLFFMAVVSVNLAVINFMPLPIVDGGNFLYVLYEQLTGRPVSVVFQNVATIAGLLLIGSVFLITTFNDLANLLWR